MYSQETPQQVVISRREKDEIMGKLSQTERLAEGKSTVKKIEKGNEKLRRALEQSMMRLSRMSVESNFLVARLDCYILMGTRVSHSFENYI